MITYLPSMNIYPSVAVLTNDQLCRQRVDAKKILDILQGKTKSHRHHPCVKMWRGYEELLRGYLAGCINQWMARGFSNNMEIPRVTYSKVRLPKWMGGPIHKAHQAALIRSNPEHYARYNWDVELSTPLFWPIRNEKR